jgi:hypothetical protein
MSSVVVSKVSDDDDLRKAIVDKMIEGGCKYLGCPRFQFQVPSSWGIDEFYANMANNNNPPYYCTNEDNLEVPENEEDKKNFPMVCYGFTNLMLRHGGVPIPFCNPKMMKVKTYEDLRYGCGGADEWMAAFYDKIEKFDRKGIYPRGTLLLRNFEPLTQGHTALLIESSTEDKPLSKCLVIHSAGDTLCPKGEDDKKKKPVEGTCPGVCIQHLSDQLEYFSPKYSNWDEEKKYPNVPKPGFDYYQAILRPEHYINLDEVEALKEERESLKKKLARDGRQSPGVGDLFSTVASMFHEQQRIPLKF